MVKDNVSRMAAEEKRIADGMMMKKEIFSMQSTAQWHSDVARRDFANQVKEKRLYVWDEMKLANRTHVGKRRERLKEFLHAELVQYEKELNAKGLAIYKDLP
eukprot:GFYU01002441.1.p2 GENE.GFYU01002441.1~~GFYU01002441.1.p2  ORF type:complete len:102 (-),score=33.43 GFYU01002441.1:97-402(-)